VVQFKARVNLHYCPAAFKNDAQFKSGQDWLKNNHLASLNQIYYTLCRIKFRKSLLHIRRKVGYSNIVWSPFLLLWINVCHSNSIKLTNTNTLAKVNLWPQCTKFRSLELHNYYWIYNYWLCNLWMYNYFRYILSKK